MNPVVYIIPIAWILLGIGMIIFVIIMGKIFKKQEIERFNKLEREMNALPILMEEKVKEKRVNETYQREIKQLRFEHNPEIIHVLGGDAPIIHSRQYVWVDKDDLCFFPLKDILQEPYAIVIDHIKVLKIAIGSIKRLEVIESLEEQNDTTSTLTLLEYEIDSGEIHEILMLQEDIHILHLLLQ